MTVLRLAIVAAMAATYAVGYKAGGDAATADAAQMMADQVSVAGKRAARLQEAIDAQWMATNSARKDAATAGRSVERLREQLRTIGAASEPGATAASVCEATPALASALAECAERYRAVAEDAAERQSAGLLCEHSYDALSGQ